VAKDASLQARTATDEFVLAKLPSGMGDLAEEGELKRTRAGDVVGSSRESCTAASRLGSSSEKTREESGGGRQEEG
jgi:hypothetical protein